MQRLLGLVMVGAPLVVGAWEPSAEADRVLAEDDACDAGDAECALEFRQLRAHRTAVSEPQLAELSKSEIAAGDEGNEGCFPGGWGEAAELQREDEEAADELGAYVGDNDTLSKELPNTLTAARGRASCAAYGCPNYFVPGHRCQCNSGCVGRATCCYDYYRKCKHWGSSGSSPSVSPRGSKWGNVKTLYHATSPSAGPLILQNGFLPGTQGWCGGGIYFAESPAATKTKAIGPNSHQGFMLEVVVDVGNVKYMSKTCDRRLTGQALRNDHFDSVSFDPGDGREWIVYSKDRILSAKRYR